MRPPATFAFVLALAMSSAGLSSLAAEQNPVLQGMEKIEASTVTLAYQRPGTRWETYKTVQIVPLEIRIATQAAPTLQQMYAEEMRAEMQKENYAAVDTPRADTLIVQARLEQPIDGSLSIKMMFSDGSTRTVVAALSDLKSAKGLITDRDSKLEEARGAFRNWAHLLAGKLKSLAAAADVDPEECFKWGKNCH